MTSQKNFFICGSSYVVRLTEASRIRSDAIPEEVFRRGPVVATSPVSAYQLMSLTSVVESDGISMTLQEAEGLGGTALSIKKCPNTGCREGGVGEDLQTLHAVRERVESVR